MREDEADTDTSMEPWYVKTRPKNRDRTKDTYMRERFKIKEKKNWENDR